MKKNFTAIPLNNPTVSEWFYSDYCNYKDREVRELTVKNHISIFSNHIKPYIGNKHLNDVTKADCNNIINRIYDAGMSYGTGNATYAVLTRIFRSALSHGTLDANNYPCTDLCSIVRR